MNKKIRKHTKVAILLLLCICAIAYMVIYGPSEVKNILFQLEYHGKSFSGIGMFYNFYLGIDFIIFHFVALLLIPIITNFDNCLNKISGFDDMIITRIGRKEYYKSCLIQSIKDIWYFPIVINLVLLVGIHFFIAPVFGETVREYGAYYLYNDLLNIIFMNIAQVIGWCLINCLCFIFSQINRNKYVYPFMLVLFTTGITILMGALFSALLQLNDFILNIFTPFTLLTSGLMGLWGMDPGIEITGVVLCAIIFYAFFVWILTKMLIRNGGDLYVKKSK